jgi:hypothetical protein
MLEKNPPSTKDGKKDSKLVHYERASASLLAEQPVEAEEVQATPDQVKDWDRLRGHLEQRLAGLRTWRSSWWYQTWAELAQYLEPRRSTWLTQSTGGIPTPNNMTRGRPINNSIVDPTGTYAVRVCSSGMMSGLASPSRPWFKIVPAMKSAQIDEAGQAWLDETEERMYTVLAGSNFYNSFAQECEDLVVYGTAPVLIYEDEEDFLRLYNPCCGEYYLASSSTNRVDGFYRAFVMTVAQIVDFFGVDNCPADIQGLWKGKGAQLNQERIVAHSIEPNFAIAGTDIGKVKGDFAWREVYWLYGTGSKRPLSMKGFVDKPFTAARWNTQSNDAYGRSVGLDVLGDVIQLQIETIRKAEALEKMVRPPLLADMQLKNQPSSSLPGHVTYVSGLSAGTGMRSIYEVNPDISALERDLAAIQARIKTGFFADLFLMLQQPTTNETAFSVAQRLQEKLQIIGPVVENIITESLKPKLRRFFDMMKRKGLLSPMPDSLKQSGGIDVQFVSLLALSQKAAATGGIERIVQLVGNMSAVFPQVKDVVNPDEVIREMSALLGNPQRILNPEQEVVQSRAAQAKQAQQIQKAQMLQHTAQTAGVAANAAQVMSQTQVGAGGDALSMLMGQGGNK